MFTNFIIFFVIFSIILLVTSKKFNILIDKKIETHKKYSTKGNSYLLGGVLLILFKLLLFIYI